MAPLVRAALACGGGEAVNSGPLSPIRLNIGCGKQRLDNAVNLDGGIVEWVAAGRPIVTDDGRDPYIA